MKLDIWVYPWDSQKNMESRIVRDRVTSRISVLHLILSGENQPSVPQSGTSIFF